MPNLTDTVLAQNFNRGGHENSNYGTRRLQFFQVAIIGYNIENEPNWLDDDPTNIDSFRTTYTSEYGSEDYLESRKSIVYPVLRGIAQIGEIMYNGEFDNGNTGPTAGNTYVIIALCEDTVSTTGADDFNSTTSKSLAQAITESCADFAIGSVTVDAIQLRGNRIRNN
jgi:hypothetical protein